MSTAPEPCAGALAVELRAALCALERGDEQLAYDLVGSAAARLDSPLAAGLARVARGMQDTLVELGLDARFERIAGSEIPDACARLDCVMKMSEEAAHHTLDLVEEGRTIADALIDVRAHLCGLSAQLGVALPLEALRGELSAAMGGLEDSEKRLRTTLTALAQAQEYQDLSGQIIRRVIRLVRDVERALSDLLEASGLQGDAIVPLSASGSVHAALSPPGVTEHAADQGDADQLLASLGF